ncbi:hypothetical protein JCM16814_15240 [Desulfobaculum senezii]
MKTFARTAALALAGVLVAASLAFAAAADTVPTKITSQKTVYDESGKTVVFTGDVLVTRPDMKIWSDKMTVHLTPSNTPDTPGTIRKIVATGNVRLKREGKTGTCRKAVYTAEDGLLTLTGKPVLKDGENSIAGKIIRLWLKDNRSEVESGDAPVEAIFFTPADGGGK